MPARESRACRRTRARPGGSPARGAARGAHLVASHDRGRRRSRQDHHLLDDRSRLARDGPRPGLARGQLRRGRPSQLALERRRVARRGGRRVRSLDAQPHVEIAVLTNVELDHHATFALARGAARGVPRSSSLARVPRGRDLGPSRAARAGDQLLRSREVSVLAIVRYDVPSRAPHDWRLALSVAGERGAAVGAGRPQRAQRDRGARGRRLARRRRGSRDRRRSSASRAPCGAFSASAPQHARSPVVIDDYAHHPTEVAVTLSAARTLDPKRLVAVFQPHLYSRTALLADEFGAALAQADVIALLDVYPARERARGPSRRKRAHARARRTQARRRASGPLAGRRSTRQRRRCSSCSTPGTCA